MPPEDKTIEEEPHAGSNALKSITKTDDELVVGNYIVLFGDEKTRDLEAEYFTKATKLDSSYTQTGTLYLDWEHGHGKALDGAGPGVHDVLGTVKWDTMKVDEMGVWVDRVLNRRTSYMTYLEPLIEAGMIGSSSKAVKHDIVVADNGEIEIWPLERDTLTVIPAEPRMMSDNVITSLKSLVEAFPQLKAHLPSESGDDSSATAEPEEKPKAKTISLEVKPKMKTKEEFLKFYAEKTDVKVEDMTDKQKYIALNGTDFAIEAPVDKEAEADKRMDSIEAHNKAMSEKLDMVLKYAEDTPAIDNAGYISRTGGKSDKDLYSMGDFFTAVQRGDQDRLKSIYKADPEELWAVGEKTDMSHIDGATGGYLLPREFENTLLALSADQSPIANMVTRVPVGSNRGQWPSLDQFTAPTAGVGHTAFAGKVTAAQTAENTALTETSPEFKLIEWNIHKIGGYTHAPNELINDSPLAIETLLSALFALAIGAKREYSILRGTGANEPLGILTSGAAIAKTTVGDNVFAETDAVQMLSRWKKYLSNGSWWMHPGVIPDIGLFEVGAGGASVFIMDLKNDPVVGQNILGKPVYYSEHLPQDDNSGDVLLADMKAYLLFERQGLQIAFSEHVNFIEDQGTWRFTQRMDGQPWVTSTVTLGDPQGSYTVSPFVYHHD